MKTASLYAVLTLLVLFTASPVYATSFQAAATTDISPDTPHAAVFADFNADGNQDMVMTVADSGSSHYLRIFSGDGSGSLSSYTDLGVTAEPGLLVAADLNGDNRIDLAVSNSVANSVSIFLGNGDGTFTKVDPDVAVTAPTALATGDFSGDGAKDDLAVVNSSGNTVSILINNGSGTMSVSGSVTTTDAPAGVAVGDFNGDDIDDIAVGRSSAGVVRIFRGSGAIGNFLTGVDVTVGTTPTALVSEDYDNDGIYDLAVVNNGSDNISLIRGNTSGSFTVASTYAVYDPADPDANPVAISAGDFNRDGVIDLAVANNGKGTVSVLRGIGDATFMAPEIIATGAAPTSIAYGDLNGSGNDLLTVSSSSSSYSLLLNSSSAVAGITVTPISHDFGKIPNTTLPAVVRYLTVTIANNGSADLGISSIQLSGANSGYFELYAGGAAPCPAAPLTIPANSSCTMQIKAAGYSAPGEKIAAVDITSDAANRTSLAIPLTAEVIAEPGTAAVTLSFIGRGSGLVEFSPTYETCTSNCTSTQPFGLVTILPTPDSGMFFYGWSGCDAISSSGICRIDPLTDRNVTANFGVLPRRVKLNTSWAMYTLTATAAYAAAASNEEILVQTGLLDENLVIDRAVNITLKGGYDSAFTAQGAATGLRSLTIVAGSAAIDNIMLQ